MRIATIDKGDTIGVIVSDGYVAALGVCHLPPEISGKGMDWFRRKLGKDSAAGQAIASYVRGAAKSLVQSPETPRGWIGTLAHIARSFAPGAGDADVVVDVPETPSEAAAMADRLADAIDLYQRTGGDVGARPRGRGSVTPVSSARQSRRGRGGTPVAVSPSTSTILRAPGAPRGSASSARPAPSRGGSARTVATSRARSIPRPMPYAVDTSQWSVPVSYGGYSHGDYYDYYYDAWGW